MSHVMPASKARAIARDRQVGQTSLVMRTIAQYIQDAADRGLMAVRIDEGVIPLAHRDGVKNVLEGLGYKVHESHISDPREPLDCWDVSWGHLTDPS